MNSGMESGTWDCIFVGARPAGLNAALVLGRARRRVVVLDYLSSVRHTTLRGLCGLFFRRGLRG